MHFYSPHDIAQETGLSISQVYRYRMDLKKRSDMPVVALRWPLDEDEKARLINHIQGNSRKLSANFSHRRVDNRTKPHSGNVK